MAIESDESVNGHVQPAADEEGGTFGVNGPNGIPPAGAHANGDGMLNITIPLNDVPAFTPAKKLRVVTIGAGYSGLILAHKLQYVYNKEMDGIIDFVIYEAKDQPGGTWVDNTYPGVQCDVPSAIYAFPFDPNPNWSHFYSSGPEILQYIQSTVKKWKLDQDIKYDTRVTGCFWEEESSQWKLTVQHGDGTQREEYADVMISAKGFLSTWHWPRIHGLESFRGKKVHSAGWDHGFDYTQKRIGIIGNGSSGIQILPEMAKLEGTDVTSFQRGPTWVFSRMTPAQLVGSDDPSFNPAYRQKDKQRFQDPEEMKKYRKVVQGGINKAFKMFVKDSDANKSATEFAIKQMSEKLNHDPVLCEKLIPKWELGCRRVTPGDGYLESFLRPNVHLTNSAVVKVDETGILTEDGTHRELDVIVCATGFDISQIPPFPVEGRNGVTLAEKWKDEPESYLSLACPDMPNYFIFTGPNATVGHGSLIQSMGWSADWMIKWLHKMAREDIASIAPKQDVVDEFVRYGDQIHNTLTWTGGCRSWYKANRVDGRVTATFAGSAILYHTLVSELRPEDFDIRYRSRNRFRFLGNGFTPYELEEGADLAYYVTT